MKMIVNLLIGSIVIITLIIGFTFVTSIIDIHTLGNRVEDSLIASGWTGFSKVDLDKIAERVNISEEEDREIFLEKKAAKDLVIEYIKKNLDLDAAFYPKDESYIPHKYHPVIIDNITIYNPDNIPAVCSEGVDLKRTTICISIRVPVDVKWLGFRYVKKHVDVDIKSFYKN